jgi:hypothetical protein
MRVTVGLSAAPISFSYAETPSAKRHLQSAEIRQFLCLENPEQWYYRLG